MLGRQNLVLGNPVRNFFKPISKPHDGDGLKMLEAALEEVKEAEKEADRLLEAEKQKSIKVIAEARNKAAQYVKDSEDALAKKKAQLIERQKEKLLAAREKVLSEGLDRLKSLRRSAEKKAVVAVDFVLEAFEKELAK